ncbi:MAG TPA: hypothetical protein ENK54_01310 [Thiotrichales bacterium]|nr:hypothetical protein [Thiotrichales bacterium]
MIKNTLRTAVLGALVAGPALTAPLSASAEGLSANLGFMSDYYFRGTYQSSSAAMGGLDYEGASGIYLGTWIADVDKGIEYDIYGGWSGSFNDFNLGVGFTTYNYTDDFDDTYKELNLSVGYGPVTLDYAKGTYDNFDKPSLDYSFIAITGEYNGFYGTYGSFREDASGSYVEVGYGTEIGGFDTTISLISNDSDLDKRTGTGETAAVFSISKSFDL